MKFTFELPVHKPEDYSSIIVDKRDSMVAMIEQPDDVDYIVQAINSYEKLVEYAQHKSDCNLLAAITLCQPGEEPKCDCGFAQALKQAEKSK